MMPTDDKSLNNWLENSGTIAVIGCSDKKYRTSNQIASYLKNAGYRIVPVNPYIVEALGESAWPDMQSLPDDVDVDIIDIFRNRRYTAEMVQQVVEWADSRNKKPLVWTQLDVSSPEAKSIAEEAGLPYIENRCLMVEHKRLLG